MKLTISKLLAVIAAVMMVATLSSAQQVKMAALPIKSSTLIDQIKAFKAADPKITPEDLAKAANDLLDKNGINFIFYFDSATCQKIRQLKASQKDPSKPIQISGVLRSVDADGASMQLPEPKLVSTECGDCYVELPVLEVTDQYFVTIVKGRNIKFHLPSNFGVNHARLVDPSNRRTKKKWLIPARYTPIGVSYDENVVYLGLGVPELAELSLLVFGEGVFQFGTRSDAENGGAGKVEPASSNNATIRFDRWERSYFVDYSPNCGE